VHPVNAALLAQGGGRYRCGKCNKNANALESLFDEWPQPGDKPPGTGDPPALGLAIDLEKARASRLTPENEEEVSEEELARAASHSWPLRLAWVTAAALLAAVVLFKLADYYDQPVAEQPIVRSTLETLQLREPEPEQPFRDVGQIHLVSRELVSLSPGSGALRLNATIVNRANRRQPFPILAVTLLDAEGAALASHQFEPEDYLADKARSGLGMTPHAFLPLSLEMEDPGLQAVGFELQFR
jgi:hypothetical protein